MKVVVTGAGGFLGGALCAAAPASWDVVAAGRFRSRDHLARVFPAHVRIHDVELTDESGVAAALNGAEVVFHFAAVSGEARCTSKPLEAALSNLAATRHIVRAARRQQVRRLVFASSFWVYSVFADRPMPLLEDAPLETDSFYGALKAAGEEMVRQLPDTLSLRLSNVYGFGSGVGAQWGGLVGRYITAAIAGRPLKVFGTGEQGLELVHVDDVIAALQRCAEVDTIGHREVNLGAGRVIAVRDVARTVADVVERRLGISPEIRTEPAPPGKVWPDRWVDITRAKATLAFEPRTSLVDGIDEMVKRAGERPN